MSDGYIYRVVDRDGNPLKTGQSSSRPALYGQEKTAKSVASKANTGSRYGGVGSPSKRPYRVQRTPEYWEDVE